MTMYQPGSGSNPSTQAAVRTVRTLVMTFMVAPILMLVVVLFAVPKADESLPLWVTAAVIMVVALGWLLAELVGYRTQALQPADDTRVALQRYLQTLMMRFAITEAPMMFALAASFALTYGPWPYLVAVVVGLPSLIFHTWPTRRAVNKFAAALESAGVPSGLRAAFGHH